jgi:hypothetical protein
MIVRERVKPRSPGSASDWFMEIRVFPKPNPWGMACLSWKIRTGIRNDNEVGQPGTPGIPARAARRSAGLRQHADVLEAQGSRAGARRRVDPDLLLNFDREAARNDDCAEAEANRGVKLVPSHTQRVACSRAFLPWGETLRIQQTDNGSQRQENLFHDRRCLTGYTLF